MTTAISTIMNFQITRGLDTQEYNGINEATNTFEEILESLGYDVAKSDRPQLKAMLEAFIAELDNCAVATAQPTTQEHIVDAHADQIVFAIGAIMKLGYDPRLVLEEVGAEVSSRIGTMVDGKFEKDLSPAAEALWYEADYTKCQLS